MNTEAQEQIDGEEEEYNEDLECIYEPGFECCPGEIPMCAICSNGEIDGGEDGLSSWGRDRDDDWFEGIDMEDS